MVANDPSVFARPLTHVSFVAVLIATTIVQAAEIKLPTLPPESLDNGVVSASIPEGVSRGSQGVVQAANVSPMGAEGVVVDGGPMSVASSGSYFNPTLGQHIRARYNTRSYGQEEGNLDLGTMGVWQMADGYGFFDGQVTMNEEQNVGYNIGLGYRWLTLPILPTSPDGAKIAGVSIWADGQGVDADNFFPQVGVSLELLGDRIDIRANGYIPVGPSSRARDFVGLGTDLTFTGNSLAAATTGVLDTPLTVGEIEMAGRIADLEAWLFGSVYAFDGGPYEEVGGKIGLRGYATHDLLLSIAIANDDLFDTNAIFSATWFIGRTRSNNCPTGTLEDRFREPVLRNDYVAIRSDVINGTATALTNTDGSDLRIVFVDHDAAAGGDGSFENPLNSVNDIAANSQENDVILLTADSTFTGEMTALQDGQLLLGEGGDFTNTITTSELGSVTLPETFAGASSAARPTITGAGGGVTLADNNTVQNLTFSGNATAIASDAVNGSVNANLNNLAINGSTGDAIALTSVARVDTDDRDNDGDTTETFNTMGSITIDQVAFDGSTGNDIQIDATSTADETPAELLTITNVTSTNLGGDPSIRIIGTNDAVGSTTAIDDFTYTGAAGSGGGVRFEMTEGTVSVTNSDFTGGVGPAVAAIGNTNSIQVGSTNTITDITGDAVVITDNTGAVDVDADISTTTVDGGTVRITRNQNNVGLDGALLANNASAVVIDDAQSQVTFGASGSITTTGTGDTVVITDAGANTTDVSAISFSGDITNDAGGRVLNVSGGDDLITVIGDVSGDGEGILIENRAAGASVAFTGDNTLNTTTNDAVTLQNNDAASSVSFNTASAGSLAITTTTGNGIVGQGASMGELNVVDNTAGSSTDSTISTDSGQAIVLADGSSTSGVTLDSATVTDSGANSAVELTGFDGTVTINGGSLNSDNNTVNAFNSGVELAGVDLEANPGGVALRAQQTDTDRTVSVSDADLNGGQIDIDASGTGDQLASFTDLTNVGATAFNATNTGSLTATMNNVASTGGTTVGTTGAGDVSLTATNGTTYDSATLSTTGAGNAQLNATDVTMNGAVIGNSTSSGNLTANLTDVTGVTTSTLIATGSGDVTSDFERVDMNGAYTARVDSGTGTVTLDNVTGANGVDLDSDGTGDLTATLTTVTGSGDVTINGAGDGNISMTATGVETGGQLVAAAAGNGNVVVNVTNSGVTTGNEFTNISISDAGNGTSSAILNNVEATSGIAYSSAGDGNALFRVQSGSYAGDIIGTKSGSGSFNASVVSGTTITDGRIALAGTNIGTVTYEVTGLNYSNDAASTDPALDLAIGASTTTGAVTVTGNTIAQTDGNAFSLDVDGGTVDFLLTGNTFTNTSAASETALITQDGTTLNATINGNTFTNSGAGPDFLYDNGGASTTQLSLVNNGAAASTLTFNNDNAAANFTVSGLNATVVDDANPATVTFDPDTTFNPALVVPQP